MLSLTFLGPSHLLLVSIGAPADTLTLEYLRKLGFLHQWTWQTTSSKLEEASTPWQVTQCNPMLSPLRFFLNHMVDTLRSHPPTVASVSARSSRRIWPGLLSFCLAQMEFSCHGKDTFLQASQLWLVHARYDIILGVGHILVESLLASADALSRCHLGQPYQDRVQHLIDNTGIKLIDVPSQAFHLSPSL